jgi:hypothetical protein
MFKDKTDAWLKNEITSLKRVPYEHRDQYYTMSLVDELIARKLLTHDFVLSVRNTQSDPNLRYCSSHGTFEADIENGNCPSCLAVGSDYCAGAYN